MDKNAEIFMNINNVELGPYHINQLVENGLVPDALVWWQGSANWMKASDVPELQPLLQQVAAAQQQIPAQQPTPAAQPAAGQQATMQCPYCGEEILAVARKCRFCGEWLQPAQNDGFSGTAIPEPSTGLPTTVGPGMPPISQPGGMPPISQPGTMPPISQPGGMPPIPAPGSYQSAPQSMGYDGTPVSYPTGYDAIPATGYPATGPMVDQYGNPIDPSMPYSDPSMPFSDPQSAPPPKKSNTGIIIGIIVAAIVAIAIAVIVFVVNNTSTPSYNNYEDTDYGFETESVEAADDADYYDSRYYDDEEAKPAEEAAEVVEAPAEDDRVAYGTDEVVEDDGYNY